MERHWRADEAVELIRPDRTGPDPAASLRREVLSTTIPAVWEREPPHRSGKCRHHIYISYDLFSRRCLFANETRAPHTGAWSRHQLINLPRGSTTHQAGGPDRGDYPRQYTLWSHLITDRRWLIQAAARQAEAYTSNHLSARNA